MSVVNLSDFRAKNLHKIQKSNTVVKSTTFLSPIDLSKINFPDKSQHFSRPYDHDTLPPHNLRYLAFLTHVSRFPKHHINRAAVMKIASCSTQVADRYLRALVRDKVAVQHSSSKKIYIKK